VTFSHRLFRPIEIVLPGPFVPVVGLRRQPLAQADHWPQAQEGDFQSPPCMHPIIGTDRKMCYNFYNYSGRLKSPSLGTSCRLSACADTLERSAKADHRPQARAGDFQSPPE